MSLYYRTLPPRFTTGPGHMPSDHTLLLMWRVRKMSTYDIAAKFGVPEYEVERQLWQAREKSKQDAEWNFDRERA